MLILTLGVDLDHLREHLETLGISGLAEWDVLAFIYRHGASLASAEQIAHLLGYTRASVGAALDSLTSAGLVERSHNSCGIRLYNLGRHSGAVEADTRRRSLEKLMNVAETRQGRLLVMGHLRQTSAGKALRGRGGLHLA